MDRPVRRPHVRRRRGTAPLCGLQLSNFGREPRIDDPRRRMPAPRSSPFGQPRVDCCLRPQARPCGSGRAVAAYGRWCLSAHARVEEHHEAPPKRLLTGRGLTDVDRAIGKGGGYRAAHAGWRQVLRTGAAGGAWRATRCQQPCGAWARQLRLCAEVSMARHRTRGLKPRGVMRASRSSREHVERCDEAGCARRRCSRERSVNVYGLALACC